MAKLSTVEQDMMAKDTGCSEHDDCLTCPLPECRLITYASNHRNQSSNNKINELSSPKSNKELAEIFGVSRRTIYGVLRSRNEE